MDERVQKLEEKQPGKSTVQRLDTLVLEVNLQNYGLMEKSLVHWMNPVQPQSVYYYVMQSY